MPDATTELLERSAAGDRDAFAAFYDATAHDAHRLALLMLGDADRADTALVEAYQDAWRLAGDFDETQPSGRTWLLAIVRERASIRVAEVRERSESRGWRARSARGRL